MRREAGWRAVVGGARLAIVAAALTLVMLPAAIPARAESALPGRHVVAVLPLQPIRATPSHAANLTDSLEQALADTGRFTPIGRSVIARVLREEAVPETGCTTRACAVRLGRVLNAQRVVTGTVERVGKQAWRLSTSLVDVKSEQTLQTRTVEERGSFLALLTTGVYGLAQALAAAEQQAAATLPVRTAQANLPPVNAPARKQQSAMTPSKTAVAERPASAAHTAWVIAAFASTVGTVVLYEGYVRHKCAPGETSTVGFANCDDARATRDKNLALLGAALSVASVIGAIHSRASTSAPAASHGVQVGLSLLPGPSRPIPALAFTRRW